MCCGQRYPCEPSDKQNTAYDDSVQEPQSDSVPKPCKKWQCHRSSSDFEVDAMLDFSSCLELKPERL